MSLILSVDNGRWRDVANPALAGSSGYVYNAVLVDNTPIALWDSFGELSDSHSPHTVATPIVVHTAATKAYDYGLAVIGLDTLPAAFTYADYRDAGDIVWAIRRITQDSGLEGIVSMPALMTNRYYLFVASWTAVDPGGAITLGIRALPRPAR